MKRRFSFLESTVDNSGVFVTGFVRFLLVTATLTLAAAANCLACDCVMQSERESFEAADTVFSGAVIHAESSGSSFTFKVDRILKGVLADEVVITSRMSDCDFAFAFKGIYIVYAHKFDGHLVVSACSATKGLGNTLGQVPKVVSYREIVAGTGLLVLLSSTIAFAVSKIRRRPA